MYSVAGTGYRINGLLSTAENEIEHMETIIHRV